MRKTFLFTSLLVITVIAFSHLSKGATYTATQSGNFSQSSTWAGGLAPSANVGNNTIIIPSGIAITLDVDIILNDIYAQIELESNASIIAGTNPHFIALLVGNIQGSNCQITADSMYVGHVLPFYDGNITVETFAKAQPVYGAMKLTVNKKLMLLPGGGNCLSCTINLNQVSRTTIVFAGGTLPYSSLDLTKPFNVRYEDWNYDLNNAPEIKSAGLTDIDIALGTLDAWHYQSDLEVRGKLMLTSGLFSMWHSNLTLGPNASVDYDKGGMQFIEGGLIVESTLSNIGNFPTSPISSFGMSMKKLIINSANPSATLYLHIPVLSVEEELQLSSGRIAMVNGRLELAWPNYPSITGGSKNSYVITEYNGVVTYPLKNFQTTIIPIGLQNHYAPIYAAHNDGQDGRDFATSSVSKGVYAIANDTTSGNIASTKPAVNMTWMFSNDLLKKYQLGLGWDSTAEKNNFDRNNCYVATSSGARPYDWDIDTVSSAAYDSGIYLTTRKLPRSGIRYAVFDGSFASVKTINSLNADVSIYPNPATQIINVKTARTANKIDILNLQGQIVQNMPIENKSNIQIDVHNLPPSVYNLLISDKDGNIIDKGRFIKQ